MKDWHKQYDNFRPPYPPLRAVLIGKTMVILVWAWIFYFCYHDMPYRLGLKQRPFRNVEMDDYLMEDEINWLKELDEIYPYDKNGDVIPEFAHRAHKVTVSKKKPSDGDGSKK